MKTKKFDDCCGIVPYSFEEYLLLKTCPVQRNHVKRARDKKTKEKLGILLPQHTFIATAELTQDSFDPTNGCLLYTSPSPRDISGSRMPSSA